MRTMCLSGVSVASIYAFLGVRLEAVLDVAGHELPSVERRHVLPLHARAQLERPHAMVGGALPRLREVAPEREVGGVRRLVGEGIADETVVPQEAIWKRPTELVSRGSRTGGSHAVALAIVPPRLGGLGLGGIQSGYVGAAARAGPAPASSTVTPTPVRLRKSRRVARELRVLRVGSWATTAPSSSAIPCLPHVDP